MLCLQNGRYDNADRMFNRFIYFLQLQLLEFQLVAWHQKSVQVSVLLKFY